jgi:hypothetical protein
MAPTKPGNDDCAMQLFLWQEEMKTNLKRVAALNNNKMTMFSVIQPGPVHQCHEGND